MNPIYIANNFLKRAFDEGVSITPMKLQKLIYFLYATYLEKTGHPLFGERFMAWPYGPVLQSVYDVFKKYQANSISTYHVTEGSVYVIDELNSPNFQEAINQIWCQYRNHSGPQLSTLTHKPGTAWDKATKRGDAYLTDNDIREEVKIIA